jgi:NAD(P)-dependent dehydrogenase (short-subunit alcohol dehydrogenase family)
LDFELADKVVIVTGGTRGVGRGIAEGFLRAGARLVVCGRQKPEAAICVGENHADFVATDVRDPEQIEKLVAHTLDRFGRLDVLINNAGGSPPAVAATASPRFSEAIVKLNLLAPLYFAQQANVIMQKQENGGSIINIASVSGLRSSPGTAAYGAAKAGLINLTKSLAIEWAPKVRLNVIAAGPIETESSHLHYGDAAGVAKIGETIPMGRLASPDDVAKLCAFLASAAAHYLTGACITLDGGGERPAFLGASSDP